MAAHAGETAQETGDFHLEPRLESLSGADLKKVKG